MKWIYDRCFTKISSGALWVAVLVWTIFWLTGTNWGTSHLLQNELTEVIIWLIIRCNIVFVVPLNGHVNYVSCLRYKDTMDDVSPLPFGPRVWFDLEFCIEFSTSLSAGQSSAVNHELLATYQSNSRKANSASVLHSFASFWSWCSAMFPKVT